VAVLGRVGAQQCPGAALKLAQGLGHAVMGRDRGLGRQDSGEWEVTWFAVTCADVARTGLLNGHSLTALADICTVYPS
jgi:hypothetical protein